MEREQARIRGILTTGPTSAGPIRRGSGGFVWPVNGPITGSFGENRGSHMHAGIDISAPTGTPIRAAASGRVALAGWTGGYGQYTCIQHGGGLSTCYAHQSSIGVSVGQSVSRGQVIGAVGSTGHSTGPHLHFEVRVGGSPVSPLSYL
jgi:murein DD-endopeptidase MepM/ murein hydrolase activator NlpD